MLGSILSVSDTFLPSGDADEEGGRPNGGRQGERDGEREREREGSEDTRPFRSCPTAAKSEDVSRLSSPSLALT